MAIRSFLAFELPCEIRNNIIEVLKEVRRLNLNVRWVKIENIHITVLFIGNITPEGISEIGDDIGSICSDYGPFDVSVKGLGVFPNLRHPRIFWVGLDGEIERMACLRDDLQKQLLKFGLKEERRAFKPHLTIGRFRNPGKDKSQLEDVILRYENIAGSVCTIDELILFKSELKPGGAEYTGLKSWKLRWSDK